MTIEYSVLQLFKPWLLGYCNCGCGETLRYSWGKWRKFIFTHHQRKENHHGWKGGGSKTPAYRRQQWAERRKQAIDILGNKCLSIGCNSGKKLSIIIKEGGPIYLKKKNRFDVIMYVIRTPEEAIKHCELVCMDHRKLRIDYHEPSRIQKLRDIRSKQVFPIQDTDIEVILQNRLRELGIPFLKHWTIRLDRFYHQVDIFIEPNICIEADGRHWHMLPVQMKRDIRINNALKNAGYRVLRFWGDDIKNNIDMVTSSIMNEVFLSPNL